MTAPAPCACWDSPVTLHDGHCCMRSADGRIPTCHDGTARAFRQAVPSSDGRIPTCHEEQAVARRVVS